MKKLYLKKAFNEAKKDKDGYVFLNVKFADGTVLPMRGQLDIPFADDEIDDDYDEIDHAFTSSWVLRDLPECAKHIKSDCDGNVVTLYWEPHDGVWCFDVHSMDDEHFERFDDEHIINGTFSKAIRIVDNVASKLCMFEIDLAEYYAYVKADSRKAAVRAYVDYSEVNDIVELRLAAICDIEKAKRNHKKIPYAEVGDAARGFIACLSDADLGKMLANGFTSY